MLTRLQLVMTGIRHLSQALQDGSEVVATDLLALLLKTSGTQAFRLESSDRATLIELAEASAKHPGDLAIAAWRILQYIAWRSDLWLTAAAPILESAASALPLASAPALNAIISLFGSAPPGIIPVTVKTSLPSYFEAPTAKSSSWDALPTTFVPDHDLRPRPVRLMTVENNASLSLTDFDARVSADLIALSAEEIAEAADAGESWLLCQSEREIGSLAGGGGLVFPRRAAHSRFGRIWSIDRQGTPGSTVEETLELAVTSAVIEKARRTQAGATSATAIEIEDDDPQPAGKRKREVNDAQQKAASKRRRSSLRSGG